MQPKMRRTRMEEAIPGVIGVLIFAVFLGFLAVDIGAIPLLIITAVVLTMVIVDLVQTIRGGQSRNDNKKPQA